MRLHPPRIRELFRAAGVVSPFALQVVFYWTFASGTTLHFARGDGMYDALGTAFVHGQLYMQLDAPPELLALSDPYDPAQRLPLVERGIYWPHDSSLYHAHFYLYFGPVPALIHAAWQLVWGWPLYANVFEVGAALVAVVAFWLILRRLQPRRASPAPARALFGCTAAFACGGMSLYLVARPAVYHEAILVGTAFLFVAWYCLVLAFTSARYRSWLLAFSGVFIGCAVGSRISYLGYALGAGLVLFALTAVARRHLRLTAVRDLAVFVLPVISAGTALLAYNWIRFGSVLEFGTSYMLAGVRSPSVSTYSKAGREPK